MLTYFVTAFPVYALFYALFFGAVAAYAPRMIRDARRVPRHHAYRTPMPAGWDASLLFA